MGSTATRTRSKRRSGNIMLEIDRPLVNWFWIEVGWIIDEEEWTPHKKSANKESDNVVWWPAFVKETPSKTHTHSLFYSSSCCSSSDKDLNRDELFNIKFEEHKWLTHIGGSQNGKMSIWRYARWEANDVVPKIRYDDSNERGFEQSMADIRGCYLELITELRREKRARMELVQRVNLMQCFTPVSDVYDTIAKVRMYISTSLLAVLFFEGRNVRGRLDVNAYSNSYVQSMVKTKTVDCTLAEYRELARESEERTGRCAKFQPAKYPVTAFGMRHNKKMTIQFDSYYSMCHALRLSNTCFSDMVFQNKTDFDGNTSVFQMIGQVVERNKKKFGKLPINYVPECIFYQGAVWKR